MALVDPKVASQDAMFNGAREERRAQEPCTDIGRASALGFFTPTETKESKDVDKKCFYTGAVRKDH